MDGREILAVDLDAHLDPEVLFGIDVPGAGVADHVAVLGLVELRALPEGLGQRREAERGEEALAVAHHLARVEPLGLEQPGEIDAAGVARGRHQVVDVGPLLGPHVAQQVGRDRALRGNDVGAVVLAQPAAHVAVELLVERPHLLPEPLQLGGELVRRHVVLGPPHGAQIVEAQLAGALVAELGEALVVGAHRRRDGAPADPGLEQLVRIAAGRQDAAELAEVEALAVLAAVLAAAVGRLHAGGDAGQLGAQLRIVRRRQGEGELQQTQLAALLLRQLQALEAGRFLGQPYRFGDVALVRLRRQDLGVVGDEGRLHPAGARLLDHPLEQGLLGLGEEALGVGRLGRPLERWRTAGHCHRHQTGHERAHQAGIGRHRTPPNLAGRRAPRALCQSSLHWPSIL